MNTLVDFYSGIVDTIETWFEKDDELFSPYYKWGRSKADRTLRQQWLERVAEIEEVYKVLCKPDKHDTFTLLTTLLWTTHLEHVNGFVVEDFSFIDDDLLDTLQQEGLDVAFPNWESELEVIKQSKWGK